MKRWFATVLSYFCILFFILPTVAFAHPGRTDGNGGHYNRSTGNYHYHHGYTAHDHYDMNGDGTEDCPYNFVDNTKNDTDNAREYAQSKTETDIWNASDEPEATQKPTFADRYGWILPVAMYLGIPMLYISSTIVTLIASWIRTQRSNKKILRELGLRNLKLPNQIVLLSNGVASLGEPKASSPYGKYTVYTTQRGKTFHKNQRCSRSGTPMHIFEIPQTMTPCRRCAKDIQYPVIIPPWYSEIKEKQKKN